jgi:hypothetical protein
MMSLSIVSLLAGAVLGWWFTIPVLMLAIVLALVVVAAVGAAVASLWIIVFDIFVVTLCLQLGYVAGSVLETYAAARAVPVLGWGKPYADFPPQASISAASCAYCRKRAVPQKTERVRALWRSQMWIKFGAEGRRFTRWVLRAVHETTGKT